MGDTAGVKKLKPKKENTGLEIVVIPVLDKNFKLAKSAYQQHNAYVPAGTTKKQLLDQRLWDHVGRKIKLHDEIRVIEENGAFVARLLVTLKFSGTIKVSLLDFQVLEQIDYEAETGLDKFFVINRGAIGWCVTDNKTSQNVFSGLLSQADAVKKMEEHVQLLGR